MELNEQLQDAVVSGDAKWTQMLLQEGADPNYADAQGKTAMHRVAVGNYLTLVALIEAGGDINQADKFGTTPLHSVADWGSTAVMKTLVDAGAILDAENINKETPSAVAERVGFRSGQQLLEGALRNAIVEKARNLEAVIKNETFLKKETSK